MNKDTDTTTANCLTSDEILAYVVYPTDPAKADKVAHIRECPHCKHRVIELLDYAELDKLGLTLEEFYDVLSTLKDEKAERE